MAMSVGIGFAQEDRAMPGIAGKECPRPFITHTKQIQPLPSFNPQDMPTWGTHANQGVGGTKVNTWSGVSFDWRKQIDQCCLVTNARLTVTFKALQVSSCGPPTPSTSANDQWSIVSGAAVTSGVNWVSGPHPAPGSFWCPGLPGVTTATAVVDVTNPSVLNSGHFSVFVEDDTEIVSASLVITECCTH
jgi:hypothetical protein